jgi:hypothetical protein
VLACGPDAALSHGSAAALWRIVPRWPSPTHVTAAFEQDRDRDADLLNAGFSTLRISDKRLKRRAAREAQRLRQILSRA